MNTPRHFRYALGSAFVLFSLCAPGLSSTPPLENPVCEFTLQSPEDPPSGRSSVTPVAFINGTYIDTNYLGATVDLAMDESGKIEAMGSIDGYTDKKEGSNLQRKASVKTVNGVPVLSASASASGTYRPFPTAGSSGISGSGKASIALGPPEDPFGNLQPVTVLNSHSGQQDGDRDKEKPSQETVYLDKTQIDNISAKDWSMKILIVEKTDAKGRPYVVASLDLTKSDGTRTLFQEKTVKFSEKNGYSFSFSRGVELDPNTGQPKTLDGKPVIDKKSQVKFSKLMFKKLFDGNDNPYWEPAAGGVAYKFLGQKGFGNVFDFDISTF